jgi:hypothetical protein
MDTPTIKVLKFETKYELNDATGQYDKARDYVTYAPLHSAQYTQIEERIDFMKPPERLRRDDGHQAGKKMDFLRHRWSMIAPKYDAWKTGNEIPEYGTPLAAWPGVNQAQAEVFKAMGVRTVEEVAAIPDGILSRVPLPNTRDLVKQAKAFLEAADQNAAAHRLNDQDRKIAELQEQLEAAMSILNEKNTKKKVA